MSLKAKIEAVIYASEEPVTLVQLVGLLGLEAQAELDALAARQNTLKLVGDQDFGDPIARSPAAGDQAGAPESPESPEVAGRYGRGGRRGSRNGAGGRWSGSGRCAWRLERTG